MQEWQERSLVVVGEVAILSRMKIEAMEKSLVVLLLRRSKGNGCCY